MNRTKFFLLTVSMAFAMAFTFFCLSGDDENLGGGGGTSSPSSGDGGKGNNMANYRTVPIGTQVWMAENMNNAVSGSKCYDDNPANCDKYGRLYDWATAKTVCPSGWHLPSDYDWNVLMNSVGGSSTAGKHLKAMSDWNDNGNGLDTYGFAALPGGYGNSGGDFGSVGYYGYWWSSSENDSDSAYYRLMLYDFEGAHWDFHDKYYLFSVRCVQD